MIAPPDAGALMDGIYRHQRHVYDATRKFYLLGRDHLIRSLDPPAGGTVLEIGCGTGRNLIAAARAYPGCRCFGIDISAEMLATARRQIEAHGLSARIVLAQADATRFDPQHLFGVPAFDRCFFSYSLSMIPGWRRALEHAAELVSQPAGVLHIVDFGQQEELPPWFRAVLFAWLRRFHVEPRADLHRAVATGGRRHPSSVVFRPLFRGYAWYAEAGGFR